MTLEMFVEWAIKMAVIFFLVLTADAYVVLLERRLLGFIQMRLGPNRVGPFGLLQPLADGLKFIFKEDIVPLEADKVLYVLAPMIALVPALMTFSVIPFGDKITLFGREIHFHITSVNVGLLVVFALTSLGVYGVALAGWSSNSKYSLMGGLRSSAQMISYELALTLSVIGPVLFAGSLDLVEIVKYQTDRWFGIIPKWNIFLQPIGFLIFLTAAIAETNRVPFDLPEAETELVAGFHTEYSSMKFAMFFIAEYTNMITASAMASLLYLGGWDGPGVSSFPILGPIYFALKVFFFLFLYIWLRGTLPRFRYDQLMKFGWKFLIPVALANVVFVALLALLLF
ncbi:MAG: NADH-quinone oxidoreductase subunit NuoH [Acidobacteriota bacterium]|nr:NADH-quinone oxidoreductase subunit NuoH [Blastocatellia bacterium]MDW8412763.1 NADH-quinone oxidoreductase subunit NuoH [Acidobacteriota bacterium]